MHTFRDHAFNSPDTLDNNRGEGGASRRSEIEQSMAEPTSSKGNSRISILECVRMRYWGCRAGPLILSMSGCTIAHPNACFFGQQCPIYITFHFTSVDQIVKNYIQNLLAHGTPSFTLPQSSPQISTQGRDVYTSLN